MKANSAKNWTPVSNDGANVIYADSLFHLALRGHMFLDRTAHNLRLLGLFFLAS